MYNDVDVSHLGRADLGKAPSAKGVPSASLRLLPREHEIRIIERDGRRWLQQWKMPPAGYLHERAWVDVGELPATSMRQTAETVGYATRSE